MKKYLENRDTENTFKEVMNLKKIPVDQRENDSTIGVYFLWLNDVIVYIGMSNSSIDDRIFGGGWGGHIHDTNKIFNHYSYFNLENYHEIRSYENFLINLFNPYFNIMEKNFGYEDKLNEDYKFKRNKMNDKIANYYREKFEIEIEKYAHLWQ
jgi:hypothetical protein